MNAPSFADGLVGSSLMPNSISFELCSNKHSKTATQFDRQYSHPYSRTNSYTPLPYKIL